MLKHESFHASCINLKVIDWRFAVNETHVLQKVEEFVYYFRPAGLPVSNVAAAFPGLAQPSWELPGLGTLTLIQRAKWQSKQASKQASNQPSNQASKQASRQAKVKSVASLEPLVN